jgi:transposase-like protein
MPTQTHKSKLSPEELKDEAYRLAQDSPLTYADIAEDLGVTENAVAKAVTMAGMRYKELQMRVVELLSGDEVEHRHVFVRHRRDK